MKNLIILGMALLIALPVGASTSFASVKPQSDNLIRVLIAFDKPVGASEQALVRAYGGKIKYSYSIVNAVAAQVPESSLYGLSHNPHVTSVEADGEVQAFDAELDNTWGVKRIGAGTVQANGNRGTGVKVAVIDTGVDCSHPDLVGRCAGGYDFVNNDSDPMDDNGHGTHVAGIIAALKNGVGVVGVGPDISLYALKVLNSSGSGLFSNIIAALQWAVNNDIQVTNNSYGSNTNPGSIVESAFINANSFGIFNVAAAGNSGNCAGKNNSVGYPASYASVIAVAATNQTDARPCFSSTGPNVELAAPGVAINSTKLGGGYIKHDGTSMASPHVAGVVALVIAAGIPDYNRDGFKNNLDIRTILNDSATDLGAPGRDSQFGYGLVDAVKAIQFATSKVNSAPIANAGADQTVTDTNGNGVESVVLNGNGSTDSDGTIVSYEWSEGATFLATGASPTVELTVGSHTITLTVTDDGGATANDSVQISVVAGSSSATLSTVGYKVKGLMKTDLSWRGITSVNVDVYRNSMKILTTTNDEEHTDNIDKKGSGVFIYKICESGITSACSNESVVVF